jgi:hypothetical protein
MPELHVMSEIGQIVESQLTMFLVLLLGLAAIHKALRRTRTQRATADLTGLGWRGAGLAAAAAAVSEAAAAGLLLNPSSRMVGALLAAALWTGYSAMIARALLAGRRDLDCGCSFGAAHRPLGHFQLLRSLLLVVLASLVAALAVSGGVNPVASTGAAMFATQLLAGVALLALYGAMDQVMAVAPMRAGEVQ